MKQLSFANISVDKLMCTADISIDEIVTSTADIGIKQVSSADISVDEVAIYC